MERHEIVTRAIELRNPPRLPFCQHISDQYPDDVFDTYEMDRAKSGWFFAKTGVDDWGCTWAITSPMDMGQVVEHPLEDLGNLSSFRPPNPRDPFYFERLSAEFDKAGDRYVLLGCHFNLFERLHMLHGFTNTLMDLYAEPEAMEKIIDMVLEFKLELLDELHKRHGDRVHGLFFTDDWGTQENTFISGEMFETFFLERYRQYVNAVHGYGWHFILHSCGKINDFIPYFIDVGVDTLNLEQPTANGIDEIGERFAGKVSFLGTVDIQKTLTTNDPALIAKEAEELYNKWATPKGGLVINALADPQALGVTEESVEVMVKAFLECAERGKATGV